jgi:hypothetical protein
MSAAAITGVAIANRYAGRVSFGSSRPNSTMIGTEITASTHAVPAARPLITAIRSEATRCGHMLA